jgi:hypothetical protein
VCVCVCVRTRASVCACVRAPLCVRARASVCTCVRADERVRPNGWVDRAHLMAVAGSKKPRSRSALMRRAPRATELSSSKS